MAALTSPRPRLSIKINGKQWLTYLRNHGRSERTEWTYRNSLRWFGDWLRIRRIQLADVGRETVEQYIQDCRAKGRHLKSIRDRVGVLRNFFAWLTVREYIDRNPLVSLEAIKVPKSLPEVLSPDEVRRFLAAAHTPRERVIARILYATGCRRAELIGMHLGDVDLERRLIRVRGKGAKDRIVLIDIPTVLAIRVWLRARATIARHWGPRDLGYLIVGRHRTFSGQYVLDIVHAIAKRAGIERRVYVHAFRHAFASHSLDRGMQIEEVRELLGHESIATTQIYTHVSLERLRESYDRAHARAAFGS